jgi:hypothetical protein
MRKEISTRTGPIPFRYDIRYCLNLNECRKRFVVFDILAIRPDRISGESPKSSYICSMTKQQKTDAIVYPILWIGFLFGSLITGIRAPWIGPFFPLVFSGSLLVYFTSRRRQKRVERQRRAENSPTLQKRESVN